VVQAIVHRLGGEVGEFAQLWREARDAQVLLRNASSDPPTSLDVEAPDAAPPALRQLPPDVFAFTGRGATLALMDSLLTGSGGALNAVVISALSGTAGVGKTALAVHWAHRVTDRFRDGQLYVDLRGYGPDEPLTPGQALAGFLRGLGVRSADIAYELAERTAQYRSLMFGRQMLVVLDNVSSVEQVRPLLPASAGCLVLVTSRDSLAGLVARDGARRIDLDLLERDEAMELLHTLIGARAEAEPAAVEALATLCDRLPLALRIAAELAASRPRATVAELVEELTDEKTRLELLDAGADARTGIRSVFSWSYRALPARDARLFRLLGLNPDSHIDVYAAAALADADLGQVRGALDALARAHLIQPGPAGRYAMHDLLRGYAGRRAERDETDATRRAAVLRLLDYYLATAARAMDAVFPAERHRRPHVFPVGTPTPAVDTPAAARAWLDDQRAALTIAVSYAARHGCPVHAIKIADVLWRYFHNGAHHQEALTIHAAALHASGQVGDRKSYGIAQVNLGTVYWRLGRHDQAVTSYKQALVAFREAEDRTGEARVLANLGAVYWIWGRYEEAAENSGLALIAFGDVSDRAGEARALGNLGAVRTAQGRYSEAAECHQQALTISRTVGDGQGEARAMDNLGVVRARQGSFDEATGYHEQALTILRELGDRTGEAEALENLGTLHRERGRYTQALDHLQQALDIAAGLGNRNREASALNAVGETLRAIGRPQQARSHHESALAKSGEIGNRYERARALNGLAHALHTAGDRHVARRHWQDAFTLYTEIGVPEAGDVKSRLLALDLADPDSQPA
jgi:tetratricopeptide (TPR) repeat protein